MAAMNGVNHRIYSSFPVPVVDHGVREAVVGFLGYLGIELIDNNTRGQEIMISKPGSKVNVMVIPTNEELFARETVALLKNHGEKWL